MFLSFFSFVTSFFAGQAPVLFQMPEPIDEATPKEARSRTGFDGNEYELVFSDEFELDGRTFWPGELFYLLFRSLFLRFLSFFRHPFEHDAPYPPMMMR
jgi:beta-glucanase (GH16 family)